jgi:hypothetical protein
MLRATSLAMMFLALPLGFASAGAGPNTGANAALKYWQAFATMPKFTDAEQTKLTAEFLTMPLDKHARDIVARADYALRIMHQGAARPQCDWSYNWEEEGIDALLPHLNAARVLSALACLRARVHFEEGRNAQAIDDIVAAMTLGRHASVDGSLIAVLVGYNIEGRTGDTLAVYLPKLSAPMIKDVKARLRALPQGGTPTMGLRGAEEKSVDWFVNKVKGAKDKESLVAFLGWMTGGEKISRAEAAEKARAFLAECGGNAEGVVRFAEEAKPSYALMAGKLALPLDQFEMEAAREAKKQAGNPVFKVMFPALNNVRRSQARFDVRHALLSAGLAVQESGRAALKDYTDPVVGGTFDYVAFNGGFELRSKWTPEEKAITLTVGRRAP